MNLSGFDLNLLKVLDALLREGSVTRAADRVGLSQPAASAALSRLRHALDDPLFVRQGQGLVTTDFARDLAQPLKAHLEALEAVLSAKEAFDPARSAATFRLAGIDFFAEMLMPRLAAEIADTAPGIRLQLVDLVPESYVATLEREEVAIALFPMIQMPDWVAKRPLFHSPFTLVARRGHRAIAAAGVAPGSVMPLDLFCDLRHILFSVEGRFRAQGDEALAALGRRREVAMTMSSFAGILRSVSISDMVALVPVQLARALAEERGLDLFGLPYDQPPPLLGMMWHRRNDGRAAHRWLRDRIAAILGPLNDGFAPLPAD
ncbi:LysR family transcriptional regulator [Rhodobacterales bacterium HKCCE2091]|nr:LysR family transcriptional regulator [Rhodobacterales bacterium HKCCE2091]